MYRALDCAKPQSGAVAKINNGNKNEINNEVDMNAAETLNGTVRISPILLID